MLYLKWFHIGCVTLSVSGFLLILLLQNVRREWLGGWYVRHLPHYVDTLLLLSGLGLAYGIYPEPFALEWLQLKMGLLLLYILFGFIAISQRISLSRPLRNLSGVVALVVVTKLIMVALQNGVLVWY